MSWSLLSTHEAVNDVVLFLVGEYRRAGTSDEQDLVLARNEAVYFYDLDGRGPCFGFDGEKKMIMVMHSCISFLLLLIYLDIVFPRLSGGCGREPAHQRL